MTAERYTLVFAIVVIALILSIFLDLLPFGYFRTTGDEVTKVYFADNISAAHESIIARFNALHSGEIEIVPVDLPFSKFTTNERKEILIRSLRSRSSRVDIFAVDHIWIPRFAKWAEPLTLYFSGDEKAQILPHALSRSFYKGSLVSIPFYIDIGLMHYRSDLLEKFPNHKELEKRLKESITWGEMIDLFENHWAGNYFYLFQGNNYEGLICNFLEVLGGNGERPFETDSLDLNTPGIREGLDLMVDLIYKYKMSPPEVTRFNEIESYRYAIENDVPFFRGWPSLHVRESLAPEDTFKLKYIEPAALPHFEGHEPTSVFGGWNLMISVHSSKKAEALEFIKFVVEEETQRELHDVMGFLPINVALYDSGEGGDSGDLAFYRGLMDRGIHRPALPNYTKMSNILSHNLYLALRRDKTVSDALSSSGELISSGEAVKR